MRTSQLSMTQSQPGVRFPHDGASTKITGLFGRRPHAVRMAVQGVMEDRVRGPRGRDFREPTRVTYPLVAESHHEASMLLPPPRTIMMAPQHSFRRHAPGRGRRVPNVPLDPNGRIYRTCPALWGALHRYGWSLTVSYLGESVNQGVNSRRSFPCRHVRASPRCNKSRK